MDAFLTASTFSCNVFNVPLAVYSASAAESTAPGNLLSCSEDVKRIVLEPVAHLGFASLLGLGIKNVPFTIPKRSEMRRRSLTTARAPDV